MRTPLLFLLLLTLTAPVAAQQAEPSWDAGRLYLTRADLEVLEERYREVTASPAYSEAIREDANRTLERIRERLVTGDFRVGDRINVQIAGESTVPETLVVAPGPALNVPGFGTIPLEGVLRAELEEHLTREIGRFIRSPRVQASSMIRVSVQGAVGRPGFYVLPATLLVGEVVMAAGGPAGNADLDEIRVERGDEILLTAEAMREALVDGRSLDQLNLQAGDEVFVAPRTFPVLTWTLVRYGLVIASSLFLGVRIF